MGRVLLDTAVLIDALRGRAASDRVRGLRQAGDDPYVCAVIVEELVRGLRLAPLGRREGALAGAWRRDAARRGRTLAQADCLIAAAAVGVGARLATGNPKDFARTSVEVEHWPVGG